MATKTCGQYLLLVFVCNWSLTFAQLPADTGLLEDLIKQGDSEKALMLTEAWMESHPFDPDIKFLHASALHADGEYDQAINVYESLLVEFPGRKEIYNNLAASHAAKGDLERAALMLETGLGVDPVTGTLFVNLREIYRNLSALAYKKVIEPSSEPLPVETSVVLDRYHILENALIPPDNSVVEVDSAPLDTDTPPAADNPEPEPDASTYVEKEKIEVVKEPVEDIQYSQASIGDTQSTPNSGPSVEE